MRRYIDTGNTVHCRQYITPWPLTHPCCVPAFFSFSMDCDRKAKKWGIFTKHCVIGHRSKILMSHDCYAFIEFTRFRPLLMKLWACCWNGLQTWLLSFPYCGLRVQMAQRQDVIWYACAEMNTVMWRPITRNVKLCMFSICLLQKLNNGCDFVPLSCIFLEYQSWFDMHSSASERWAKWSNQDGRSTIAYDLRAQRLLPNRWYRNYMLQQQHYTICLF